MKTLGYFLVLAIFVFAGCTKDEVLFESQDILELKKTQIPVPVKADCFAIPDQESALVSYLTPEGTVSYTYSKLNVSGTSSHIGKLNPETNFYVLESLELFYGDDGHPYTLNKGYGKIVSPNGDEMGFTLEVIQSFDETASYTGKTYIVPGSGTGRFKGCTGFFDLVGAMDFAKGGTWFKMKGYLVYE